MDKLCLHLRNFTKSKEPDVINRIIMIIMENEESVASFKQTQ